MSRRCYFPDIHSWVRSRFSIHPYCEKCGEPWRESLGPLRDVIEVGLGKQTKEVADGQSQSAV